MIGITLSPEQIHQAPPEVRRWLEQQIIGMLGPLRAEPALEPPARHLVACDIEEARAILAMIQGSLPVTGVFFALGREPAAASAHGLRALRISEMLQHAHLQTVDQLAACLRAIDQALQQMRDEPGVALTALDGAGHCLVAESTARSILTLWQEIVANRFLEPPRRAPDAVAPFVAATPFQAPYAISLPGFATETQQTHPPESDRTASEPGPRN
jgi:hypothetical protein